MQIFTYVLLGVGIFILGFLLFKNRGKSKTPTTTLVTCALLTAVATLLGGALSIPTFALGVYSVKLSLGSLPVILSGVMYGPFWGAAVGFFADMLQALLFPKGAYVVFFSITGMLFGLIPGLFFIGRKKPTPLRLFIAIALGQIGGSVIANTVLLVWLYGSPWEIIYARLVTQAFVIPIHTALCYLVLQRLPGRGVARRV